jgi:CheY-like chemotaxis protein
MPIPSVLIVDPSADNREVLRTALARRGLRTIEADAPEQGLALARIHRPDVIVLDVDDWATETTYANDQFTAEANDDRAHLIVLGKVAHQPAFASGHLISKPYHFAPLVHTIEGLAAKAA